MFNRTDSDEPNPTAPNRARLCAWGFAVGVVTGLVGAGGGFLIVPALTLYGGLHIRKAIGTSLSIIAINALSGFAGDAALVEDVDWMFLVRFSALAALGIFVGTRIGRYLAAQSLRRVFAVFIVMMAVYILLRELVFQ